MCRITRKASLLSRFVVLFALVGMFFLTSTAIAEPINFENSTGYGITQSRVMIEDIRVDTVIENPFDPAHPTIITAIYNVPFYFDYATLHLIPDLAGLVVVDDGGGVPSDNYCANLDVHVSNAFTGSPITGALIESGAASGYTDFSGYVQLTGLVSGSALLSGSASGYVSTDRNVTLGCGANSVGLAMSPTSGSGSISDSEIRVVLTWGENPRDLDSHMTGPNEFNSGSISEENNRFHVYYSNRDGDGAGAALDTDDTSSFGPETITVSTLRNGLYRYSVHHYSGTSDISHSNASVQLWQGNTLVRTYAPPAGSPGDDAVWTVFELFLSPTAVDLYDVNTFTSDVSASSVRTTTTGYGSVETGVDFTRLPSK